VAVPGVVQPHVGVRTSSFQRALPPISNVVGVEERAEACGEDRLLSDLPLTVREHFLDLACAVLFESFDYALRQSYSP